MTKIRWIVAIRIAIPFMLFGSVYAQGQDPQAATQLHDGRDPKKQIVLFNPTVKGKPAIAVRNFAFATPQSCATVPQASAAKAFYDHALYMTQDIAASLKITWIATGNLEADKNSLVFVRDYAKFARCRATDNTGSVLYGSRLLSTVLVDQTDISGGANFAVAAASATVKGRSVQVSIDSGAFADSTVGQNATAAQNQTASGLNVDHYADFNKSMGAAYTAAQASDVATMEPIGFEPDIDITEMVKGLATTFALDRIVGGWGCDDAVKQFNQIFTDKVGTLTESSIRSTYQQVAKGCSASSPLVKATANAILNGQRIVPGK